MPKVGNKKTGGMKFPYSKKGMEEALNYAKQSGRTMQIENSYAGGGKVMPKYQMGGRVGARPMARPMARAPMQRASMQNINPGMFDANKPQMAQIRDLIKNLSRGGGVRPAAQGVRPATRGVRPVAPRPGAPRPGVASQGIRDGILESLLRRIKPKKEAKTKAKK